MSILIKGMEMPESCDMCAFSSYIAEGDDHEELWYCILDNWNQITPILLTKETVSNGRSMDCPLIELAPHGRLIDADALMLHILDYIEEYDDDLSDNGYHNGKWCAMKEAEMVINDAPTIIEAEGRE